ncbi:3-deoxy-manno-octulosonate cytidylyltransferase [bacterium]|nr:3-deoxy-manno-octulosonate cytidylyltransferase [bacterium]
MIKDKKVAIIIPARYGSSRLPGKPLLEVNGKTILEHVWLKAKASKYADKVILAVDDDRIFNCAMAFGANVEMTSTEHKCGSDRIAEVLNRHQEFDFVINLQGDEPMITPEAIDGLIEGLFESKADISTLIRKISQNDAQSPNLVKCVFDNNFNALYFSRSLIPYPRNSENIQYYGHIGMYGYTKSALLNIVKLPQTSLEIAESLEQLRALQNGYKINVVPVELNLIGIDTMEDFEKFKAIFE